MRFVFVTLALVVTFAALASAQEDRPRCEKCGMFWDNSPTMLSMEVKVGEKTVTHLFECVNCAYNGLHSLYDEEPEVTSFLILDYTTFTAKTQKMLDGYEAFYLFGTSRLKGSMAPFTPAFATEKAAKQAQSILGGELVDFDGMMKLLAKHNGDKYEESGHEGHDHGSAGDGDVYLCPCSGDCCDDIISDQPGECPKCGMTLVKKDS